VLHVMGQVLVDDTVAIQEDGSHHSPLAASQT
jgi:hypothetical protein